MDWFFREWVYGTEIPSYHLAYSLAPADGGGVLLTGTITQSGVGPGFKMRVPIYGEFDGRMSRLGFVSLTGHSELSASLRRRAA